MTQQKTFLSISLLCVVLIGVCLIVTYTGRSGMHLFSPNTLVAEAATSTTNTAGMRFEVVTTIPEQNEGLGGRVVIPDNYAMLFVFPQDGTPGFWMKDMFTSIDMIWLTDNGTIVAIDSSVSPYTYPEVFYPPQPIRYVLETRAGFAAEKGWTVGTRVDLPAPYGSE